MGFDDVRVPPPCLRLGAHALSTSVSVKFEMTERFSLLLYFILNYFLCHVRVADWPIAKLPPLGNHFGNV